MSRRRNRILRFTCLIGCVSLFVGLIVSYLVGGSLIAAHPASAGLPPATLPVVSIEFESGSQSTICGWESKVEPSRGVVILLHGIRSTRRSMIQRAVWLRELGYTTLLIDVQAHGESTGDQITIGYLEKFDVDLARHRASTR